MTGCFLNAAQISAEEGERQKTRNTAGERKCERAEGRDCWRMKEMERSVKDTDILQAELEAWLALKTEGTGWSPAHCLDGCQTLPCYVALVLME